MSPAELRAMRPPDYIANLITAGSTNGHEDTGLITRWYLCGRAGQSSGVERATTATTSATSTYLPAPECRGSEAGLEGGDNASNCPCRLLCLPRYAGARLETDQWREVSLILYSYVKWFLFAHEAFCVGRLQLKMKCE
ncbi:hypothetical protein E2C01_057438 [Portunus trituberculatus]|uniref:Uncharacterized protein n=1 Tax=Portunus trituberculatus TaxID=210409 RepID=A0A5B7GTH0_PORTR|nr:hypothetical protein [Portunus trituberculatus]